MFNLTPQSLENANIPREFWGAVFTDVPEIEAKKICLDFVNKFRGLPVPGLSLYLFGQSGVGKTFLSVCIAKYLMLLGKRVFLTSADDVVSGILNHSSEINMEDHLRNVDVLILDDLGKECSSKNLDPGALTFASQKIFNILKRRGENFKSSVITSNIPPGDIRGIYKEAFASFFCGKFYSVKVEGADYRQCQKEKIRECFI